MGEWEVDSDWTWNELEDAACAEIGRLRAERDEAAAQFVEAATFNRKIEEAEARRVKELEGMYTASEADIAYWNQRALDAEARGDALAEDIEAAADVLGVGPDRTRLLSALTRYREDDAFATNQRGVIGQNTEGAPEDSE